MAKYSINKKTIAILFREYWNNYLTVQVFADAYGLSKEKAYKLLELGKIAHNKGY